MHIWAIEKKLSNGEWKFFTYLDTRFEARQWIKVECDIWCELRSKYRIRKYVREEPGTLLVNLNG